MVATLDEPIADERLRAALARFGHRSFRPGQEEVVRALLAGRDALAIFPTGSGKSLTYQLTAQLLDRPTVVVSPLIALMRDQVDSLDEVRIPARMLASTQTEAESARALEDVEAGRSKLLYVTPERFANDAFVQRLRALEVALLVVDEAHCISEWGHDFRPAYLLLEQVAARLGRPRLLALTATATPWVRDEIVERLGLHRPLVAAFGNDRPNLFLEVRRVEEEAHDRRVLEALLCGEPEDDLGGLAAPLHAAMQGSGIVYVATVRRATETVGWLRQWGIAADAYHGRRRTSDRDAVQEAFMDGRVRVVVATNAFGLGVDTPDVRFVVHRDVPASLEAYYQEAGRAGRDGELARCTLVYRNADLGQAAFLAGTGTLERDELERAREVLLQRGRLTRRELAEASELGAADVHRVVEILAAHGVVRERRRRVELLEPGFDLAEISLESEKRRRAYERSRLEMMRGYADTVECRRRYVLNYFGEELDPERCRRCDNHVRGPAARREEVPDGGPFTLGMRVRHAAWGDGLVQRVTEDAVTVLFDRAGYKTLAAALVLERGLLEPI